jgi:hypothetical protein
MHDLFVPSYEQRPCLAHLHLIADGSHAIAHVRSRPSRDGCQPLRFWRARIFKLCERVMLCGLVARQGGRNSGAANVMLRAD